MTSVLIDSDEFEYYLGSSEEPLKNFKLLNND